MGSKQVCKQTQYVIDENDDDDDDDGDDINNDLKIKLIY